MKTSLRNNSLVCHKAALLAALLPCTVLAQQPAATPSPARPPTPPLLEAPAVKGPPFELEPAFTQKPATTTAQSPAPASAKGGIMLNFQGASLTDVLNYLSEAAGFVIVQGSRQSAARSTSSAGSRSAPRKRSICSTRCSSKKATWRSATAAS